MSNLGGISVGISESRLRKWAHRGSQDASKRTHEAIRKALDQYPPLSKVRYAFDLQGSYKNDTNIQDDSDVDVVLELQSTSHYKADSTYEIWKLFRRDALGALKKGFSEKYVGPGNKSIKVKARRRRLAADVVVCLSYDNRASNSSSVEGIAFWALHDKRWIVSHPKKHHENGADKSRHTSQRYKRTVRMFKSARNYLESEGRIGADLAPSYFVECLVYNAPDSAFKKSFQDTYCEIVNWMGRAHLGSLVCQNEQAQLFGPSPQQWNTTDAKVFIGQLAALWNDWG